MNILIKSVQLIDGTNRPATKADVLVKNDRIAAIGSFPNYRADEIVNGMGAYLAPGFIDIHNTSDRYLAIFSNPLQNDFVSQGVTTIIGGECGVSLAPLIYGSLESIKEWANVGKVNIDWHSMAEFLKILESKKFGVNFGTLTGHNTVRQAIVGNSFHEMTKNEFAVMAATIERTIKEGSFGVSVGLGYGASRQTPYSEIRNLAEKVASMKALYAVHLRNEKRELVSSISEAVDIAKETGSRVMISHLRPLIGFGKEYDAAIDVIDKNITKAEVYFNLYPFSISSGLVQSLLPNWLQNEEREEILRDIETPGLREKILRELPRIGGEEVTIMNAPGNDYLIGKTLKDFSENRGLNIGQGILALMKTTRLQATILYKNIQVRRAEKALCHERAIVASNSASFGEKENSRRYPSVKKPFAFKRVLEFVEKQKAMPVETAIYKMTGLPAKVLGLKNRGVVKDGNYADLVIFRGGEITEVLVNGKRVVKNGNLENVLAGKILRKR